MKVGLLICDHVAENLVALHGSYPDMFRNWLSGVDQEVYFVVDGQFPSGPQACDAWLINGSRHSVYEEIGWIQRLADVVREIYQAGRPCVGVCFGHQMIGHALGGRVAKSDQGWCVGIHTFSMKNQPDWAMPAQESVDLLMMCQDQVLDLPPDGTVIASATSCPVGIMQVGETMLGIQAHPEFSPAYDRVLMESRVGRMGEAVVAAGIESLSIPAHSDLMASWVRQFYATRK